MRRSCKSSKESAYTALYESILMKSWMEDKHAVEKSEQVVRITTALRGL